MNRIISAIAVLLILPAIFACDEKENDYLPLEPGTRYVYAATIKKDGKLQRLPTMIPQGRGQIDIGKTPVVSEYDATMMTDFSGRRTTIYVSVDETSMTFEDAEGRKVSMKIPLQAGDSFDLEGSPYHIEVVKQLSFETDDWGEKNTFLMYITKGDKPVVHLYFTPGLGFSRIEFVGAFYGVPQIKYDLVEIGQ